MTLWQRRVLYIVFMLIFFVGASALVFYTSGYRYNFKKGLIQKTGIIFVESDPKKASVYFNGKLQKKKTPMQIDNLLANEYQLRLEKEGYYPWEKIIRVDGGYTTNVQYIKLFRDHANLRNIYSGTIINFQVDQDGQKIAFTDEQGRLFIYNFRSENIMALLDGSQKINEFKFGNAGNILSVKTENNFLIIDLSNPDKIITIDESLMAYADSIKMDYYSAYTIYFINHSQLFKYNLVEKTTNAVLPYVISDYMVRGNVIYILTNDSLNRTFIKKVDLLSDGDPVELGSFSVDEKYTIKEASNYAVTLFDEEKNNLLLLDLKNNKTEKISDARGWAWDNNEESLAYYTESELWSYNISAETSNDKKILLTRLSDEINDVIWYDLNTHILYSNQRSINVIENLSSAQFEVDLISASEIQGFTIDKNGEKFYFWGQIGNQEGIFAGLIK